MGTEVTGRCSKRQVTRILLFQEPLVTGPPLLQLLIHLLKNRNQIHNWFQQNVLESVASICREAVGTFQFQSLVCLPVCFYCMPEMDALWYSKINKYGPCHPEFCSIKGDLNINQGTFLAVQWLTLCLLMQEVWVQSVVGELRSHVSPDQKTKP